MFDKPTILFCEGKFSIDVFLGFHYNTHDVYPKLGVYSGPSDKDE